MARARSTDSDLASEYYFAKPLDELDAGELALLIGLVKGPSLLRSAQASRPRPRAAQPRAEGTRGCASDRCAAAKRATAEPLGLRPPGGSYVPAYLDLVRRHLKRDYAEADLAAAGLSVYTSLDPRAQAAAERALTRNLQRLDAASRVRDAHLEGAVIVAEPNSGDVVAVVGGREVGAGGFNRALDARRPIGSLVKPAVYLTALETGRYTAATTDRGRADRAQARRRQHLGAAELHARDLRSGAAGARARRIDESRDRAAGARRRSAAGRRDAAAARARDAPDAQSFACCSAPWR